LSKTPYQGSVTSSLRTFFSNCSRLDACSPFTAAGAATADDAAMTTAATKAMILCVILFIFLTP
jgi:hypothetical protein